MTGKIENLEKDFLKKAIMRVIVFFDMFDYPPTCFEIWQYLSINTDLGSVENILSDAGFRHENNIVQRQGFYFFKGRESIINIRMSRYNYTDRKFKIALRVVRIFKFIPWIRMAAIGNIIGTNNLDDDGDIDLFIVTDKDRAWITRFFCASLMAFFNMRPKPGKEKDKICLSFFVDDSLLNMRDLKISKNDIYFDHWLLGMRVIYDRDDAYNVFINDNKWIKNDFPNWIEDKPVHFRSAGRPFSVFYREVFDLVFGGLNYKLKNWQISMMPDNLRQMMNKDKRVMIGDGILKLHVNDRREKIMRRYLELIDLRFSAKGACPCGRQGSASGWKI